MKIVTGVGENAHVTPEEFRMIFEGTFGNNAHILDTGERMAPELVSNNLLKIKSGLMCDDEGNISSVDVYDEVELKNGTQGMKRIDLIVNRYTKNDETKIEKNEWICITGTPAASNPVVPAHITGSLRAGDLVKDIPFIKVHFDGLNITEVKRLLEVSPLIPKIANNISNPNLLINGDFQMWQRGESFEGGSATAIYTTDRWVSCFAARVTRNSGSGIKFEITDEDYGSFFQHLEVPNEVYGSLVNKPLTLSVRMKTSRSMELSMSLANTSEKFITKVNVWETHTATLTPTESDFQKRENGFSLRVDPFRIPSDVTEKYQQGDIIEVAWVKLEQGSIATPFVPRNLSEEMLLCKRYYQIHKNIWLRRISNNLAKFYLPCEMRIEPTVTGTFKVYSLAGTDWGNLENSAIMSQSNQLVIWASGTSDWYVASELITLDAEIYQEVLK